ncbi:NAD(P)/FAD-dependent oxidoreductase [Candidatus Symbiobacter mobilis]|uniref:Dehydrogenase-like protein n=1 Tax=Candidatus Symbiobacter mobilis CR TaxID=946483 RepID=U5NBC1_9BURK|nr:NAD(P)/FAD-dependent oxidoreductase [Candidatus Symbiobacter mobilis]AGX88620.1 dehydrogenase-like protein [Candidatus Symbiobacter mobilis CR]
MTERVDCVVVGAGVVGLAVARALAISGREVLVLEACAAIGTQTSARNSEVLHAGIHYPTGSRKAQWCVAGSVALYDYCAARGVAHRRCGKLVVAQNEEQSHALQAQQRQAHANGAHRVQLLDRESALALEPGLRCSSALWSPDTGIVDSHGLMLALCGDLEHAGGSIVLRTPVQHGRCAAGGVELLTGDGVRLHCQTVVNAAGVHAPALARHIDGPHQRHIPTARYAKGNYFTLAGKAPFSHLIYPVPERHGLGVHLTLDLAGQARFGPDVEWVDSPDALDVDPHRAEGFYAAIRQYWPALPDGALLPGYAGIRPKIEGPAGLLTDFLIQGPQEHGAAGLVHLYGIESPGLTSCLAIAEHVERMAVSLTPSPSPAGRGELREATSRLAE